MVHTSQAMRAPTTNDAVSLPADPAVLAHIVMEQAAEITNLETTLAGLRREKEEVSRLFSEQLAKCKSQIDWLQRQIFGRKSEKIDPNQMWLDQLTIQAVEQNPSRPPQPLRPWWKRRWPSTHAATHRTDVASCRPTCHAK